jgi:hypothetical protein
MSDDAYFRSRKAPGPLEVKIGDRVAYARYFLKCLGTPATDDAWRRRGTVVSVENGVAQVHWDGSDGPIRVLTSNLAFPGPNLRFCS